ncbi:helix-turn-helix domain-containing protein [Erythrobacter sp. HKB08]|uniref:MarR family transcriptional regulator n=1 Tax=Erythrobacter sp. HKB08 TaxID=2502843 RepID=UPI001008DF48|nr:MarR family winged helix-turn-helix transcriptional regulator [Erythrobacter sp. HKB08]
MNDSLTKFSRAFGQAGVEVFTIEGRIIMHLLNHGDARIKELLLASESSYRGFYLAIERLKTKGVVTSEVDPHDRRARLIRLANVEGIATKK